MNSANLPLKSSQIVQVPWNDRWTVYHRLQELGISCYCSSNQPLEVQLSSPTAVIQLWSVVKHCSSSRQELIQWLQTCWDLKKT
ncbi:conserved hypothetical protein [Rippkaea orientalis PCC 8801]|uniref:Uncharacterized protein n=1 Tax=Rippkaea orientalis (strain PCC 8801 / RF-1) TaxID=41431 RepID=B7K3S1_RIPO1|nr:Asr1405/Asl0597 family protein [Rippkaea orientalis]ACK66461.1 conserved hypothetical protein [Rippkaea orientalis PCC 8801]